MPHPSFEKATRHITAEAIRQTLMEMVDIPSPTGGEGNVARYLVGRLNRVGFQAYLQDVTPGRPNAVGVRPGSGDGINLLFTGHMDTSYNGDEEYLTGEGFKAKAVYRDGWIWGLGASNMKSGLASSLVALEAIAEENITLRGDLLFGGVVGETEKTLVEEFQNESFSGYGIGSKHLVTHGVTADFAILTEPTGLKVCNANMGCVWAKITAYGTVSHAARSYRPEVVNAVQEIHRVQSAIQQWAPDYQARHEFMGENPNVTIACVRGGWPWRLSRNPVEASLYLDVRTVPGQTADQVKRELRSVLKKVAAESGRPEAQVLFYVTDPPTVIDPQLPVVQALKRAHRDILGAESPLIMRRPGADSTHFTRYDVPCAVYGPGGINHPEIGQGISMDAAGEHASVDNLAKAARVYLATALDLCSKSAQEVGLK